MDAYHLRALVVMGAVGLAAGAVMHRSDYCLTAMVRDLFLTRSTFLLRTLVVAVGLGAGAFETLRLTLGVAPSVFFVPASLGSLAGGVIFGLGMVTAGGCVIGSLYRLGAGQATSLATVLGLVAGNWLYAELHPLAAAFAGATRFFGAARTVPEIVGLRPLWVALLLTALSVGLGRRWFARGLLTRNAPARGYLEPWKAALILMGLNVAAVAATAMPMGVTTTYAKAAAWLETAVAPAHAAGLAYFADVRATVALPAFGTVFIGGAQPVFDSVLAVQLTLILGIAAGSFASAVSVGEFAFRYRVPARQYAWAFAGGVLMTLGARVGGGCNVFHLLGGIPALSAGSVVFFAGLLPGAWLGGRVLTRFILRLGPEPSGR